MASPSGPLNGTDVTFFTGSNEIIAYGTTCTLNITQTTRDTTKKADDGWKRTADGLRSWTIDVDGLYAWNNSSWTALTNSVDDIFTSYITSRANLTVTFGTNDTETGDTKYSGTVLVSSISVSAGTEDNATYSVSCEGLKELTVAVS